MRKSQRAIIGTWHSEQNKSKATSSLFSSKMIETRNDTKYWKTKQRPNTEPSQTMGDGMAVGQWKGAWLQTEGRRVLASPAPLRCGPWARHCYPSIVLVQPRKTHPCLTERVLMGRKESNQTNKTSNGSNNKQWINNRITTAKATGGWPELSSVLNVIKFWILVAKQKGLDKMCRPRSGCFWRSSLIRVFPVAFCEFQPWKATFFWEQKKKSVGILDHFQYISFTVKPVLSGHSKWRPKLGF